MMKCKTCHQEYSPFDFVTLRNLCEHVYLDSLAQKLQQSESRSPSSYRHVTRMSPGRAPRQSSPPLMSRDN